MDLARALTSEFYWIRQQCRLYAWHVFWWNTVNWDAVAKRLADA